MAVLVEALSVIVRRDAIEKLVPGGWEKFIEVVPNGTQCFDDELARVGFMSPAGVDGFVTALESFGLRYISDGHAMEMAVVDQITGPLSKVTWLEFAPFPIGQGRKVSSCWLFDGPRMGAGIHMKGAHLDLAVPPGWRYEDSLSAKHTFIRHEDLAGRLKFLRHQDEDDVFEDLKTGEEVFIVRRGQR